MFSESCVVCAFVRRGKRRENVSSNFFIIHSVGISDAKVCRTDGSNGLFGVGITDYCVDSLDIIPDGAGENDNKTMLQHFLEGTLFC